MSEDEESTCHLLLPSSNHGKEHQSICAVDVVVVVADVDVVVIVVVIVVIVVVVIVVAVAVGAQVPGQRHGGRQEVEEGECGD